MEYFWSFELNNERWNGGLDSAEKCIEDAKGWNSNVEYVYIGEIDYYKPSIDVESVVERLTGDAYNDCGECSEQWLSGIDADVNNHSLQKKLNKALYEWLEEIGEMPFFGEIINVKKYNLKTGEEMKARTNR